MSLPPASTPLRSATVLVPMPGLATGEGGVELRESPACTAVLDALGDRPRLAVAQKPSQLVEKGRRIARPRPQPVDALQSLDDPSRLVHAPTVARTFARDSVNSCRFSHRLVTTRDQDTTRAPRRPASRAPW